MEYFGVLFAEMPRGTLLREITARSIFEAALIAAGGILLIRYVSKIADALSARSPGARFILKWTEQAVRLIVSFATILPYCLFWRPIRTPFLRRWVPLPSPLRWAPRI
jgi:hypothetical protein